MPRLELTRAVIDAITSADASGAVWCLARVDGETDARRTVAYPALSGPVAVGDTVVLNTTATALKLGTGGVDFVLRNESHPLPALLGDPDGTEHIVKLRYTPLQHAVRTVETDPAYASLWEMASTLLQTPVIVCGLHSQIAPVCAGVKAARPQTRIAYVMTDSAALPLAFSRLVGELKTVGLLEATLTAGQAFGGDYECVTVPSALLAARFIARADVIVLGQGPGNAGTGTRFGFSGIEQGPLMDLVGRLWGVPIGVLRLSLADKRERHRGLSHHSVTALGLLAQSPGIVAFPVSSEGDPPPGVGLPVYHKLRESLANSPIAALHTVEEADGSPGLSLLAERGVVVTSMGRTPEQDPLFFHAAASAGTVAALRVRGRV